MSTDINKVDAFILARRAYKRGDFSSHKRIEKIIVNAIKEDVKNELYSKTIPLDNISMKLFDKYKK